MVGCVYNDNNLGGSGGTTDGNAPVEPSTSGNADSFTALPDSGNVGQGTPGINNLVTNYSVRWSGNFNFSGGTYQFSAGSDDGEHVYIDGTKVWDQAWNSSGRSYTVDTFNANISAGTHNITYEFMQDFGGAEYRLSWIQTSALATLTPCQTNVCTGATANGYYYYQNKDQMISSYCLPQYDNCSVPSYVINGTNYWFRQGGKDTAACQNLQSPPPACSPTASLTGTSWANWADAGGRGPTVWANNNVSNSMVVYSGANFELNWSSTAAASCTIDGRTESPASGGSDNTYTAGGGGWGHTYVLSCISGTGVTASGQLAVSVPPNPSNIISSCLTNGNGTDTFNVGWTLPNGYNAAYVRVHDETSNVFTGLTQDGYVGTSISGSGAAGIVPGHSYSVWVQTDDTGHNSAWSEAIFPSPNPITCPNPGPSVALSAVPASVAYNAPSTLSWTVSNVTSCTDSNANMPAGSWNSGQNGSASTGALTATQTYGLTCVGPGGSASNSVTVSVAPAPINGSCGSGAGYANGKTYAFGTSGYAPDVQCAAGTPSNTAFPAAGSSVSWTCNGQNGGSPSPSCSAAQAGAPVGDPTSPTATTVGTTCNSGQIILSWTGGSGATSYNVYRNTSNNAGTATQIAANLAQTNLTDSGLVSGTSYYYWVQTVGNATQVAFNTNGGGGIAPTACPTVTLTANPPSITSGNSSTLTWSMANASSCSSSGTTAMPAGNWTTATNNAVGVSTGALITGSYTYGLTCTNPAGDSASASALVSVNPPICAGQTGTVTLTASPIDVGSSTTASVPGWSALTYTVTSSSIASVVGSTLTGQNGGTATVSAIGTAPNGASGCAATTNAALDVRDFSVSVQAANPPSISAGNSSIVVVNIGGVNGGSMLVNVAPPAVLPAGWHISPLTGSANPGGLVAFSVSTDPTATATTQSLSFTGSYNGVNRSGSTSLTVTAPAAPTVTMEAPHAGDQVYGVIDIKGYAVVTQGVSMKTVELWASSSPTLMASSDNTSPQYNPNFWGNPRPDLSSYSSTPGYPNIGFDYPTMNVTALGLGPHDLVIKAYDNAGNLTTLDVPVTVIPGPPGGGAPGSVTASQMTCPASGVHLVWSAGAGATSYNIYRATHGGVQALLTTVGNILSYDDTSGDPTLFYDYWVESVGGNGTKVPATSNSGPGIQPNSCPPSPPVGPPSGCNSQNPCPGPIGPPPPPPGGGAFPGGGSPACGFVRLEWTDNSTNETSFKLYKSSANSFPGAAGLIATVNSSTGPAKGQTYGYDYQTPDPSPYYYWVTAYSVIGGESTPAPINPDSSNNPTTLASFVCQAQLNKSDKLITAVNGSTLSHTDCNANSAPLPTYITPRRGDILSFTINLCNQNGSASTSQITITDTLTDLKAPPAGFNAKYAGTSLSYDGACAATPSPIVNHYCASGASPTQVLTFNLTSASDSILAGSFAKLTYDAQLDVPVSFTGQNGRFQNNAVINYFDGVSNNSINVFSPLQLFIVSNGSPTIIERP